MVGKGIDPAGPVVIGEGRVGLPAESGPVDTRALVVRAVRRHGVGTGALERPALEPRVVAIHSLEGSTLEGSTLGRGGLEACRGEPGGLEARGVEPGGVARRGIRRSPVEGRGHLVGVGTGRLGRRLLRGDHVIWSQRGARLRLGAWFADHDQRPLHQVRYAAAALELAELERLQQ